MAAVGWQFWRDLHHEGLQSLSVQPAWLVVAHEEDSGTALAVDLALDGFPVLALAEDGDRWETDLVAESFVRFVRALEAAAGASPRQR